VEQASGLAGDGHLRPRGCPARPCACHSARILAQNVIGQVDHDSIRGRRSAIEVPGPCQYGLGLEDSRAGSFSALLSRCVSSHTLFGTTSCFPVNTALSNFYFRSLLPACNYVARDKSVTGGALPRIEPLRHRSRSEQTCAGFLVTDTT